MPIVLGEGKSKGTKKVSSITAINIRLTNVNHYTHFTPWRPLVRLQNSNNQKPEFKEQETNCL